MKRVCFLVVIVAMYGLGSCTLFTRKTELKTDVDSLSYFFGMARAEGVLMNYLVMQAGLDTNYMDAFYKGYKDGAKKYSPKDVAYLEGMRIAQMINNQWVSGLNHEVFMGDSGHTVNRWAILSGFYNGMKDPDPSSSMHIQTYSQILLERIKDDYKKEKYAEQIEASKKLFADNKNKPGIKTTETGLQYRIITEGKGPIPDERAKVRVNYRGTLMDGTEFDSSYKNDEPASFRVNGVIRGWTEALMLMPVGSKWELFIPENLAYGPAGQLPVIPPYAPLIFEVELLEIEAD
jgi:FKBP-type peptidyl-prolyl cis-trans isomerase FklB